MKSSIKSKAVFLDRDGTINKEVSYLRRIEDLRLLPGTGAAISMLNKAGYKAIVVTNQSGIARGFLDQNMLEKIHETINERLSRDNAHIDAWYYCPHHPEEGSLPFRIRCSCRKPEIGLIQKAQKDFSIDLGHSFMVGDSLRDMEAGWRAGLKTILVLSGYGKKTLKSMLPRQRERLAFIAKNLLDASKWIVEQCPKIQKES